MVISTAKSLLHFTVLKLRVAFLLFFSLVLMNGWGQTTFFSENMGTPTGTTAIASNTFQNSALTFSGSGDVRNTSVSSGYTGASGGGNVLLTNTSGADFIISGINTSGWTNLSISFGAFKSTTASSMSELALEWSSDGTTYNSISFPAQATGTGTAVWRLVTISSNLPAGASTSNLRLRWRQTSSTPQFRIDDVTLSGTPPTPTITSISPSSATAGGSGFTLTVNGTNFINGISTVRWNGSSRTTTFVSATQLTATIPASDITSAGTATVTVINTGNATASNGQTFSINSAGAPPVINSSLTASATYGTAFSYTITATNSPTGFNATGLPSWLSRSGAVISGTPTVASGTFSITIEASNGNGLDSKTLDITVGAKSLTVSGLSYANKVYDKTNSASISGTPSLVGVVGGDNVTISGTPTATFASVNVNSGITVNVSGYTLSGSDAAKYTLTQPSGTANITAKTLTITGLSVPSSKTYDGTTSASVSGTPALQAAITGGSGTSSDGKPYTGDAVSISGTAVGTYNNANVASATTVTISGLSLSGAQAGNYTLNQGSFAATITKANQTISGLPATDSKTTASGSYSLGATASSNLTVSYSSSNPLVATISGSTVTITGAGTTTITASQAGDANWNAASDVTQTLTVTAILATYPFTGTSCSAAALAPSGVAANSSFTSVTTSSITCNSNVSNAFSGNGSWGTSFSATRYIQFRATANTGYQLTITSISLDAWRSGAGATSFALRSSLDNYASDLLTGSLGTSSANFSTSLSSSFENLIDTITFRIYAWGGNSSGDFRADNISVGGTVSAFTCSGTPGSPTPLTLSPASPSSLCNGYSSSGITFSASGSIPAGANYGWQYSSTSPSSGFAYISGATNATYTVPTGLTGSNNYYRLVVKCSTDSAISDVKQITVIAPPAQPSAITGTNPACENTAGLVYSVTPVGGVTYNWTVPSGWSITAGNNSTSGQITVTSSSNTGNIVVTPSINGCNGTTRSLSVTTTAADDPFVRVKSNSAGLCAGVSQTFTATPTFGGSSPSYQWYKNGSTVGTNSATYTVTPNAEDQIWVVMTPSTDACVTASSATSNLALVKGLAYDRSLVWQETFGTSTSSSATSYTGYSYFSNTDLTVTPGSSTVDIRSVVVSPSGGSNLFFVGTGTAPTGPRSITFSGINTTNAYPNRLAFELFKAGSVTIMDSSSFKIEVSTDGTTFYEVPYTAFSGTARWDSLVLDNVLPKASNVRLRFTSSIGGSSTPRIDNLRLYKYTSANATIDTSGPTIFCSTGNLTLTANPASGATLTYLWTGGSTANNIAPTSTGSYTLTITDAFGCTSAATKAVTVTTPPNAGTLSGTQNICTGGTTTFSTNGNAGGTYSSLNTGVATVNSSSGLVTGVGAGTTTIRYIVTGTGGCANDTATRTITVNVCGAAQWTGNINTNWNEVGNWSSGIPATNTDVDIPAGRPRYPLLEVDVTVAKLTIASGATFTIPTGRTLEVTDTLKNNGTCTVNSGGSLIQAVGSELAGNGTFTVKRVITGVQGSRFIGSPINNVSVNSFGIAPSGTNGGQVQPIVGNCNPDSVAVSSPIGSILELREDATPIDNCSHSLWYVKSSGTLTNARGYSMYTNGSQTLSFSGKVNNGIIEYPNLTRQAGSIGTPFVPPASQGTSTRGWHIVSNPYPSPINLKASELTAMGFNGQIQIWQPTSPSSGNWIASDPLDPAGVDIAIAQGFQIRKASVGGTANFTLSNSNRRSGNPTFYKNGPREHYLNVTLEANNSELDKTMVYFYAGATDGFDDELDANRLSASWNIPLLYSVADGERMRYNAYEELQQGETKSVPLGVHSASTDNFSLVFNDVATLNSENITVTLEDKKENTFSIVNDLFKYNFTRTFGEANERFVLHFNKANEVSGVISATENKVVMYPNPSTGFITLALGKQHGFETLQIFDVNGKVVYQTNLAIVDELKTINIAALSAGVYTVRASGKNSFVSKLIKE